MGRKEEKKRNMQGRTSEEETDDEEVLHSEVPSESSQEGSEADQGTVSDDGNQRGSVAFSRVCACYVHVCS
jgi:hypothetical protein